MCWLAHGRSAAAVTAMQRLLAEAHGPVQRSRLLPAAVEILLAAGNLDEARRCAEELTDIGSAFGIPAPRGGGRVRDGHGQCSRRASCPGRSTPPALPAGCGAGSRRPTRPRAPAVVLARALRAVGDEDSARAELATARRALVELGAAPDVRTVDQLTTPQHPAGLSERELQVLRLVAEGRSNPDIARVLVLSHKTVARHLSNIFVKLDVSSRTAAAAYAHEHGLTG